MNNKCNNCAKFLTCDRKKCKKITFVKAGIIDKPKIVKRDGNGFIDFMISMQEMQEAEENLRKAMQRISIQTN